MLFLASGGSYGFLVGGAAAETFSDDIDCFFDTILSPPVGERAILDLDFSFKGTLKVAFDFFVVVVHAVRCEF